MSFWVCVADKWIFRCACVVLFCVKWWYMMQLKTWEKCSYGQDCCLCGRWREWKQNYLICRATQTHTKIPLVFINTHTRTSHVFYKQQMDRQLFCIKTAHFHSITVRSQQSLFNLVLSNHENMWCFLSKTLAGLQELSNLTGRRGEGGIWCFGLFGTRVLCFWSLFLVLFVLFLHPCRLSQCKWSNASENRHTILVRPQLQKLKCPLICKKQMCRQFTHTVLT